MLDGFSEELRGCEPSKTLVRPTLNSSMLISLVTPTTKTSTNFCSSWASVSVYGVSTFDCPSVMTIAVFAKPNRSLAGSNTTVRRVLFATKKNRHFMFYAVREYVLQRQLQCLSTTIKVQPPQRKFQQRQSGLTQTSNAYHLLNTRRFVAAADARKQLQQRVAATIVLRDSCLSRSATVAKKKADRTAYDIRYCYRTEPLKMPRLKQPWLRDHAAHGYSRRGNFGALVFASCVSPRTLLAV